MMMMMMMRLKPDSCQSHQKILPPDFILPLTADSTRPHRGRHHSLVFISCYPSRQLQNFIFFAHSTNGVLVQSSVTDIGCYIRSTLLFLVVIYSEKTSRTYPSTYYLSAYLRQTITRFKKVQQTRTTVLEHTLIVNIVLQSTRNKWA
jgi:hypothetical protein